MDDRQRHQAGMAKRRKTLGNAWVDKANASKTPFNSEFQDFITRCAWGEVWTRPHFDERTRRVLVIGTMLALECAGGKPIARNITLFADHLGIRADATTMGLTLPNQFRLNRPDGACEEHPLADHPIYAEAHAVAQARRQLSKEQFKAITSQSAEVRAVNKALSAGSSVNDLVFAMPVVLLPG
jgi:alkylhydroperoxidase/carboxymuconolactone decarboxylase family protein YurZ